MENLFICTPRIEPFQLTALYSHLGAIHLLFSGIEHWRPHPMFPPPLYTSWLLIGWEHQELNILFGTNLGLCNGQTSNVTVCSVDDDYFIAFNRKDSNERAKNLSVVSVADTPILDRPFKLLQSQRLCLSHRLRTSAVPPALTACQSYATNSEEPKLTDLSSLR